jgi:Uma2 family endonuclease
MSAAGRGDDAVRFNMSILLRDIEYPESDGKPMAETPLHMRVMWDSIQTLNFWYADNPKVYVWGNMFLYYRRGDSSAAVSPDVMAIYGVDKNKERNVFKVWEERRRPSAVIEITSRKTKREDQKDKFVLYRDTLKVKEYFLFDPRAEYLKQALKGFRLRAGQYVPIEEVDGRLPSKVLDLHLQRNGRELRFWNPATKTWLPTPDELREMAQAECDLAEQERDLAKREVEFERYKRELAEKETEIQRLKSAQAEAEIERLRRELDASKQTKRD